MLLYQYLKKIIQSKKSKKKRISPKDEKILLQRVKEEIETKSNNSQNDNNNKNRLTNKTIKEPEDKQIVTQSFINY